MSEDPQSAGSEPVTSVVGRLLQHIVALLEARVDLTRQEMRAALRDVAISLFLLVAALALVLLMIPVAVAVLVLVLAQVLPVWLATAIVLGVMLTIVAVLLIVARLRLRKRRLTVLAGLREDWRGNRQVLGRERRHPGSTTRRGMINKAGRVAPTLGWCCGKWGNRRSRKMP